MLETSDYVRFDRHNPELTFISSFTEAADVVADRNRRRRSRAATKLNPQSQWLRCLWNVSASVPSPLGNCSRRSDLNAQNLFFSLPLPGSPRRALPTHSPGWPNVVCSLMVQHRLPSSTLSSGRNLLETDHVGEPRRPGGVGKWCKRFHHMPWQNSPFGVRPGSRGFEY